MNHPPDEFHNLPGQSEGAEEEKPIHRHPSIPTLESMRAWAHRLLSHPAIKANPDFARQLEARVLERNAELHRAGRQRRWWWPLSGKSRKKAAQDDEIQRDIDTIS